MKTAEIERRTQSGWVFLWLMLIVGVLLGLALYWIIVEHGKPSGKGLTVTGGWLLVGWIVSVIAWGVFWHGFYTLQPNEAAVLVLFGRYTGTDRASGFKWINPLMSKIKVSLRARNLNMQKIKVNDSRGNPIEIAAVVVWQVQDSAQAKFDVDNFEDFVTVQSEAALRHLAGAFPYDATEEGQTSLRGSMDEVSHTLLKELQERVTRAGVNVEEARLSHLAYAPEIAGAMLQRQQAEAIVAARTRIVDGAVGIVEMALEKLAHHELLRLDEERKAAMVNNLLVVLCGDRAAHPVINTGTLYS